MMTSNTPEMPVLPVLSTDASALDEVLCTALGVEPRQMDGSVCFVHRIQHSSYLFLKMSEEIGMRKVS